MPTINLEDRNRIIEKAEFLKLKGYDLVSQDDYSIDFSNSKIKFTVFYERYDESSDISIRFLDKNEVYSIGWLSFFMEQRSDKISRSKIEAIFHLIDFIQENYNEVIKYDNCANTEKLIEEFVRNSTT